MTVIINAWFVQFRTYKSSKDHYESLFILSPDVFEISPELEHTS